MSAVLSFGPALWVAAAIVIALNAYALMGGADFGGGVWDLLARGERADRQRGLIADAIGPIWEANHVWLILVIVLLFTGFPPAFARLTTVLHVPLTLMLVGIVLRGSAFTFRSYGGRDDATQRRWGRTFAVASVITPLLLGVVIGAIAAGRVQPVEGKSFVEAYVWPWLSPFPLAVGAMALALFAFLAAVYLTVAAPDDALREDFRRRALGAAAAVFVTAFGALALAPRHAPLVAAALGGGPFALVIHLATAIAAIGAIIALWTRRFGLARVAAAGQVSLVLWGWAVAQLPWIVPPDLDLAASAAPTATLRLVLVALGLGALLLVPSLWYLFRLFGARVR